MPESNRRMRRRDAIQTSDPTEAPLGNVLDFMRLLWAIDHALQRASKRMASTLGVTGPQRLVIRIVGRFPGISAGELAQILHLHPSTLTGVLRRLSRRGLIRRKPDSDDHRRVRLSLTDTGRKSDQGVHGTIEGAVRHALRDASAVDLAGGRRLLRRLEQSLETLSDARVEQLRQVRSDSPRLRHGTRSRRTT
jgi:MarR family transcriptional regulator, organic hydroperoxide resistance regulator